MFSMDMVVNVTLVRRRICTRPTMLQGSVSILNPLTSYARQPSLVEASLSMPELSR
jgi:hypothetical protein